MRDLKFRAWDNKSKEWLLGYELPNLGGFSLIGEAVLLGEWGNVFGRYIVSQWDRTPEDLVIMQYTGLKDKKGKEIYEGDVVRTFDHSEHPDDPVIMGTVIFEENRAAWCIHYGPLDSGDTELAWDMGISGYEVIGNVYEHPELLLQ